MLERSVEWMRAFVPQPNTVPRAECLRAVAGALVGLFVTAILSDMLVAHSGILPLALVAPMGASAVLLFCVPASPLAQPWSVIGGNTISALVGITCAHAVADPMLAAPLAGACAILVMFRLRCLHPPSGAVALTAVLGGPAVHAAGYTFAFFPVGLNSALIVLAALVFNNLTGRRYPHAQSSALRQQHATHNPAPTARLGFTAEDLDATLARYGQVLDVSRDDLEDILLQTESRAYARRIGGATCGAIMSKDVVTVTPATPLAEVWRLLRHHDLDALPVLDASGRIAGMVGQGELLEHAGLETVQTLGKRLRGLLGHVLGVRDGRAPTAGAVMRTQVITVEVDDPIAALVPSMANGGRHHVAVVDARHVFAGIISQSDVLAALFEHRLATA